MGTGTGIGIRTGWTGHWDRDREGIVGESRKKREGHWDPDPEGIVRWGCGTIGTVRRIERASRGELHKALCSSEL